MFRHIHLPHNVCKSKVTFSLRFQQERHEQSKQDLKGLEETVVSHSVYFLVHTFILVAHSYGRFIVILHVFIESKAQSIHCILKVCLLVCFLNPKADRSLIADDL